MDQTKRIIIYVLYFILCMAMEAYILWLFPYTGLGGLFCWPLAILFSIVLGYIIYRLANRHLKMWQFSFLFFCVFIFQISLQLCTTPQDFGGTTFSKIEDTYKAYIKYDKIKFTDFPNLTTAERVAFIYKFKEKLPNTFVTLQIDSTGQDYESINSRTYVIENRNRIRYYDSTKLKLIENDTATVIIEYSQNNDTVIHKVNRNFLNIKAGGWGDKGLNLNVNVDDFKIETGIEKLLYGIFKRTKPNR